MKIKDTSLNERGVAHLGLIILIVAIVALGAFAYMRVSNSSEADDGSTSSQTVEDDQEQQALDAEVEADQAASDAAAADVTVQESENVIE